MAAVLLKFIFTALSTISSLVSRVIFNAVAYLLVLVINAFRVPGQATQAALERVADGIKACLEYVLQLIMESISSLISTGFDYLVEAASQSVATTGSVLGGLMEKLRSSLDELSKDVPEVLEGFSEMITNIVTDLWNNYKEAVGYVTKNA